MGTQIMEANLVAQPISKSKPESAWTYREYLSENHTIHNLQLNSSQLTLPQKMGPASLMRTSLTP